MNKLVSHLVVQFRQFYKNLTPVKRLSIMAASTVSVIALAVVAVMVSGTNNVPLFTNVPPEQLPQIGKRLHPRKLGLRHIGRSFALGQACQLGNIQ